MIQISRAALISGRIGKERKVDLENKRNKNQSDIIYTKFNLSAINTNKANPPRARFRFNTAVGGNNLYAR
jgi:hypothetical protein